MEDAFRGRVALVTGGTRGIGLASALALGRRGAHTVITFRWGSADEDDVLRRFSDAGAFKPLLVQADVSQPADTAALLEAVAEHHDGIDIFVSNASGGALVKDVGDLTERALLKTMQYGTWPTVDYLLHIRRWFGAYPRHVVAISSTGPDRFSVNYDLVAASRAALETLCRYLSHRLRDEGVCLNVVRTLGVFTDAFDQTFGSEAADFFLQRMSSDRFVDPEEVAETVAALCSGLLDGVSGQVITVDRGATFFDRAARLYIEGVLA